MIQFGNSNHLSDSKVNNINMNGFGTTQLCMLKAFTHFLDHQTRCRILCIIKIIELQECMAELKESRNIYDSKKNTTPKELSIQNFIKTLKEELPKEQQDSIRQLEEMMETMELYQEMMSMKEEN